MIIGGWPFRLTIHRDELLSSYLVRSAHAHGSGPYVFLNMFWPTRAIWNRDIDRDPDPEWLNELATKTGLPFADLQASSLLEIRSRLSSRLRSQGDTPLLLSSSVYHRTRRLHALQYCPGCLSDEQVYFRKIWRVGFALTCDKHSTPLLDGCPHCDAPIIPHRTQLSRLATCFSCQQTLSSNDHRYESIPASVLHLEERLQAALASGLANTLLSGASIQDAFSTFRSLLSVSTSRVIQGTLRQFFGLPEQILQTCSLQFEHARWRERVQLLETLAHWITDWPMSFLQGSRKCGITQTTFSRLHTPTLLREQLSKLPCGSSRTHLYVPILNTPEMRRLKRRDPFRYRIVRAERMLRAGADQ